MSFCKAVRGIVAVPGLPTTRGGRRIRGDVPRPIARLPDGARALLGAKTKNTPNARAPRPSPSHTIPAGPAWAAAARAVHQVRQSRLQAKEGLEPGQADVGPALKPGGTGPGLAQPLKCVSCVTWSLLIDGFNPEAKPLKQMVGVCRWNCTLADSHPGANLTTLIRDYHRPRGSFNLIGQR